MSDIEKLLTDGIVRFLKEFTQDSALFINRFLVGYNKDKLVESLLKLGVDINKARKNAMVMDSYTPITRELVWDLYLFYEGLINQVPSTEEIIVYRGCDTLEDGALRGVTATSLDINIANIFNYGTILKIHIPKGSHFILCGEYVYDEEKQIILPPCDYEIISDSEEIIKGRITRMVEVSITPRDLLDDFALAMQNPPQDYFMEHPLDFAFQEAFTYMTQIMIRKTLNTHADDLINILEMNQLDEQFPDNQKKVMISADIVIMKFLKKVQEKSEDVIEQMVQKEFDFVSPEEQKLLVNMALEWQKRYHGRN